MAAWLVNKVAAKAREVSGVQAAQRPVEELAAELEQQARIVADRPQSAHELLLQWLQQAEVAASGSGGFVLLAAADPSLPSTTGGERVALGFKEALLRSRAFELFLDTCSRVAPLRLALQKAHAQPGSDLTSPLIYALGQVADQLLLPGSLRLWPGLLEALLDVDSKTGQDQPAAQASISRSSAASKARKGPGSMRWEQWARRVLATLKRGWQSESLPRLLNHLDHRLSDLAGKCEVELGTGGGGTEDLLRSSAPGARLSKQAIRAALAREKLRTRAGEAAAWRLRSELLCGACSRLSAAVGGGASRAPKLQRLVADADDALAALDTGVKAMHAEQESLSGSLGELGGELQRQITGIQMTRQAFSEKKAVLQEERKALQRRLEELDIHLEQLEQEESSCATQEKQLQEQLQSTTAHFERMIASAIKEQKSLADEKLRGVAYKECALLALDVVREYLSGRGQELAEQLTRRRGELQRTLAQYFRAERLRLEVAGEALEDAATASAVGAGGGQERAEAEATAKESWQATQRVLRRAEAALATGEAEAAASPDAAGSKAELAAPDTSRADTAAAAPDASRPEEAEAAVAVEGASRPELEESPVLEAAAAPEEGAEVGAADKAALPEAAAEEAAAKAAQEEEGGVAAAAGASREQAKQDDLIRSAKEIKERFAKLGYQRCVDCDAPMAEWASVSHGTFLCTECAGRHRGLGVHLSFVRSTTMDKWSNFQLKRMELGGNHQFQEFLRAYPRLGNPFSSREELARVYSSRAAAFYRRRLTCLSEGRPPLQESPPSADDGCLPEAGASGRTFNGGNLSALPNADEAKGNLGSTEDDEASGSFLQEREAFEAVHAELCRRLDKRSPIC